MDRRPEMTPPEITALYERKRSKNLAVLGAIAAVFVLFFAITIIRMS